MSGNYPSVHVNALIVSRLTSVLSMNAAISSSVVLASRLENDLAVFSLILFSVQIFALFPVLRRRLQVCFPDHAAPCTHRHPQASTIHVQLSMTITLSLWSLVLIARLSSTVAYLYSFALCSVSFLAPGILVWAQRYKKSNFKVFFYSLTTFQ